MEFNSTNGPYRNGFNTNEGADAGVTGKRKWGENQEGRRVLVAAPWLCQPFTGCVV